MPCEARRGLREEEKLHIILQPIHFCIHNEPGVRLICSSNAVWIEMCFDNRWYSMYIFLDGFGKSRTDTILVIPANPPEADKSRNPVFSEGYRLRCLPRTPIRGSPEWRVLGLFTRSSPLMEKSIHPAKGLVQEIGNPLPYPDCYLDKQGKNRYWFRAELRPEVGLLLMKKPHRFWGPHSQTPY